MTPRVRTARPADIPALVRVCRAALGPDDYVLLYLSEMVKRREIRIVADGGRIVAMAGVTECADGGLWLGQLRTHPRFRGRGYATLLLDDTFARLIREGRPALRLWTSRRNKRARALFERDGFRRIAMFSRLAAPPLSGHAVRLRTAQPPTVWRRWRRSLAARDGRGYVEYRWHFLPLTRQVLTTMGRRHELVGRGDSFCVLWTQAGDPALYGSLLAGGQDTLLLMRRAASTKSSERVEVFLPARSRLVAMARRAGYDDAAWGRSAIVYERSNLRWPSNNRTRPGT